MAKVQKLFELQQTIAFTEYDFYKIYEETFKSSDLGRVRALLPLRKMAGFPGLMSVRFPEARRRKESSSAPNATTY